MKLLSSAFRNHEEIPKKYTGEGEDISPPLSLVDVPAQTKSIALIVDDPDAPMGIFVHWIAWNIQPSNLELTENAKLPNQGKNDFGDVRYGGPMPPKGESHRYFFKAYALDTELNLSNGISKHELLDAIKSHVLDQAEYIGIYQR
ncbi:MAG: YbhB/YbcL family Raf kinase inhibitor-like protein [Waddliaceae bacterium]